MRKTKSKDISIRDAIIEILKAKTNHGIYLRQKHIVVEYLKLYCSIKDDDLLAEYKKVQPNFCDELKKLESEKIIGISNKHYYYRNPDDYENKYKQLLIEEIHFSKDHALPVCLTEDTGLKKSAVTIAVKIDSEDIYHAIELFNKYYEHIEKYDLYGTFEQNGLLLLIIQCPTKNESIVFDELNAIVSAGYEHQLKKQQRLKLN